MELRIMGLFLPPHQPSLHASSLRLGPKEKRKDVKESNPRVLTWLMFSKLTSMKIIYWSLPLVLIFLHILLSKFCGWHLTFRQFLLVKYWKAKGKEVEAILSIFFFKWSHKRRLPYCSQTNFEILVVHLSSYSGLFVWSGNTNSDFTRLLETLCSSECGPWTKSIDDTS